MHTGVPSAINYIHSSGKWPTFYTVYLIYIILIRYWLYVIHGYAATFCSPAVLLYGMHAKYTAIPNWVWLHSFGSLTLNAAYVSWAALAEWHPCFRNEEPAWTFFQVESGHLLTPLDERVCFCPIVWHKVAKRPEWSILPSQSLVASRDIVR